MNNIDSKGYDEENLWQNFLLRDGWVEWVGGVAFTAFFQYHGYKWWSDGSYMRCCPAIVHIESYTREEGALHRFNFCRDNCHTP